MENHSAPLAEGRQEFADSATAADINDEAIAFWEPLAGRNLTREDARQIRENLTGFFRLLLEWDMAAQPAPTTLPERSAWYAEKR